MSRLLGLLSGHTALSNRADDGAAAQRTRSDAVLAVRGPSLEVRSRVGGERMVCFGDELPAAATNGRCVSATVHEIAGGPALADMNVTLRDVAADEFDPNAILDLLEHVALGRTRLTHLEATGYLLTGAQHLRTVNGFSLGRSAP